MTNLYSRTNDEAFDMMEEQWGVVSSKEWEKKRERTPPWWKRESLLSVLHPVLFSLVPLLSCLLPPPPYTPIFGGSGSFVLL